MPKADQMLQTIHLKRSFLFPTETFVYKQLVNLMLSNATVLAHNLQNFERFPIEQCENLSIRDFCSESKGLKKRISELSYKGIKYMPSFERDFLPL